MQLGLSSKIFGGWAQTFHLNFTKFMSRISQNGTILIAFLTPVALEIPFQILILDTSYCLLW